ncbi:MAG: hypothetical protein OYH77_03065 [Pseudomonadota bacterium]|nr:hypothetical protein [Pseudomonadota bacterium]
MATSNTFTKNRATWTGWQVCSFTLFFALLTASTAIAARQPTPQYVKEIIQFKHPIATHARVLLDSVDYRFRYARELGFPSISEYLTAKATEGMSEEEARGLYEVMFINSELSEYELEQALTNNPNLRADIIATTTLATVAYSQLLLLMEEYDNNYDDVMLVSAAFTSAAQTSEGLALMFKAIDTPDLTAHEVIETTASLAELDAPLLYSEKLRDHIELMELETSLAEAFTAFVTAQNLDIAIKGTLGEFLLRINHLHHPSPKAKEKQDFRRLGLSDAMIAMTPDGFTTLVANAQNYLATDTGVSRGQANKILTTIGNADDDANQITELDYAVIIDLIYEVGTLSPAVYTSAIATDVQEYEHVKDLLEHELDYLGMNMADLVSLLRHPQRPASLVQVLQLQHRDYSIADIRLLEHGARDAILMTDSTVRQEFLDIFSEILDRKLTLAGINKLTRTKGQFVFALLDEGYELEDIQPHYYDYTFFQ